MSHSKNLSPSTPSPSTPSPSTPSRRPGTAFVRPARPRAVRGPRVLFTSVVAAAVIATGSTVAASSAQAGAPARAAALSTAAQPAPSNDVVRQNVLRLVTLPFNRASLAAVDQVVSGQFVQHDARIADGRAALTSWISDYRKANPRATISVKRVIVQGDLALVHSNIIATPKTRGEASADIYRLSNGKIVEHWNVTQAVPATTVTGNDMFSTLSSPHRESPDPRVSTASTQVIADAMVSEGVVQAEEQYGLDPYYQHNTTLPNGLAVIASLPVLYPNITMQIHRVIVDHDYIAFHDEYHFDATSAPSDVLDLWRVRNGKIVEHWDVVENVPTNSANNNGVF